MVKPLIKVKYWSQLKNKLMFVCSVLGVDLRAAIMTLRLHCYYRVHIRIHMLSSKIVTFFVHRFEIIIFLVLKDSFVVRILKKFSVTCDQISV